MIRHIALFRFEDDVPEGTLDSLSSGLAHLAETIPQLEAYAYGPDLGLRSGNFDFAVVADVADAEAFTAYAEHPAHQAFLKEQLAPILVERVAVQFEL